jgi:hypothetical protein
MRAHRHVSNGKLPSADCLDGKSTKTTRPKKNEPEIQLSDARTRNIAHISSGLTVTRVTLPYICEMTAFCRDVDHVSRVNEGRDFDFLEGTAPAPDPQIH